MPNGADRDFVRFIRCIETFRILHDRWPTSIRLDTAFIMELQKVLSDDDYKKLNTKITIIPDGNNPYDGLFIAEDDEGNTLDLLRSKFITGDVNAVQWLGISWPDYGSDFE